MEEKKITAYKGFDKDLKCRGFQYEVGKEYEMDGDIECCKHGFHACEYPMDVLGYYSPADSRFCQVAQSGGINKVGEKTASSKIHVQCEIGLKGIIDASVKFILDKVNWKDKNTTNTGYYSAATVEGKDSVAIVTGRGSKARGSLGCWLVLTEREEWNGKTYPIKEVKAVKVDGERIKADTFYELVGGEFKEVKE